MRAHFWGHACFSFEHGGKELCVDPYRSRGLAGAVKLPPLPDRFDAWVSTHDHDDHAAGDTIPGAPRLHAPCEWQGIRIESRPAAHDEFGGRLRGGMVQLLRLQIDDLVIVHCGDLGERPTGTQLAWLQERPIDWLIVPVGGYFTLGPDGAAELTALLKPRWVTPCHAREDGVELVEIGSRAPFLARFAPPTEAPAFSPELPGSGVLLLQRAAPG